MDKFLGKWNLEKSDNFEEYLKAVGVSVVTRKIATALKTSLVITSQDNDRFNIRMESSFKCTDLIFKLGEEFEETTADQRNTKTVITLEGDGRKLVQVQKDVDSNITRELTDDNTLVCTFEARGVVCTRVFKRA